MRTPFSTTADSIRRGSRTSAPGRGRAGSRVFIVLSSADGMAFEMGDDRTGESVLPRLQNHFTRCPLTETPQGGKELVGAILVSPLQKPAALDGAVGALAAPAATGSACAGGRASF